MLILRFWSKVCVRHLIKHNEWNIDLVLAALLSQSMICKPSSLSYVCVPQICINRYAVSRSRINESSSSSSSSINTISNSSKSFFFIIIRFISITIIIIILSIIIVIVTRTFWFHVHMFYVTFQKKQWKLDSTPARTLFTAAALY